MDSDNGGDEVLRDGVDGDDYLDDDYVPPSQRGVLFFSSVPRDMRPQEVLMHFGRFGKITRHKFTPFPKKERRPGGPLLPLQFMRGHVEFARLADARVAAAAMNGTAVACRRRRRCYGQLWTVRVLEGVTWGALEAEAEAARRGARRRVAEAVGAERAMNEAYRAAAAGGGGGGRPGRTRGEGVKQKRGREGDGPKDKRTRRQRTGGDRPDAS